MSQEWKAPASEEEDVQMPLGTGGDAPTEEYVSSAPKFRVNTSTLALVLAFGAALTVLYFLGQQNKQRAASAADVATAQQNDSVIQDWLRRHPTAQGPEEGAGKGDELWQFLHEYLERTRTARVEDPGVNPFERVIAIAPPPPPPPPPGNTSNPNEPPQVDPLLVEASKEYKELKLQLVMLGTASNPSSAMINNQMVHVGTKFKYLTVSDIKADGVVLSYKDQSFDLKSGSGRP